MVLRGEVAGMGRASLTAVTLHGDGGEPCGRAADGARQLKLTTWGKHPQLLPDHSEKPPAYYVITVQRAL